MKFQKKMIIESKTHLLLIIFICAFGGLFSQNIHFVEISKADFPKEETNLRKWDAPVVADLDQDAYPDLILNDHGLGVSICWNNNGRFLKPYDLIMGDLHGISVGDFDMDGNLEIIISRGGGSGSNARNAKMYRVNHDRTFTPLPDFDVPLELMRGRTVKFMDANKDGNLDLLNFAFPSKEKKGKSENYIYKNNSKKQLILDGTLPPTKQDGQKTLITDWNNDGYFDLLIYGHQKVKAYVGKEDLTFTEATEKVLPFDIETVTSIVEWDYDNDGDFDLLLTRGKGFEIGETFYDKKTKKLGFYTSRGDFEFGGIQTGDVLKLENYHTQWPYINSLFIGETGYPYEFPGELHSGKDIHLVNSNALGFPDQLREEGIYIGYVGNKEWKIAGSTKSSVTGVVHRVENWKAYSHAEGPSDILLENKDGIFEEASQFLSFLPKVHTTGAAVADFDNNGWTDVILIRRGDLIHKNEAIIILNKGNGHFESLENHQVISSELGAIGLGVETFDYNQDGKTDVIIGNERGKWHLFKNISPPTAETNYLLVKIKDSPSGKATALGALITMDFCGNKQIKRVGSTGAAYSQGFNSTLHFGLSNCKGPVRITVIWTNGESLTHEVDSINKSIESGKQ